MGESLLVDFINKQIGFVPLKDINYVNEYETMRFLCHEMPKAPRHFCKLLTLQFLRELDENENMEWNMKSEESKREEARSLREKGNAFYTGKGEKRDILAACRLYNDAIFSALECGNEELPLAFANRAAALQAFGYYGEAYDDCVYALKTGYPEKSRHKIVTRQAYCALQLKRIQELESHLAELSELMLNESFENQFKELIEGCIKLKESGRKEIEDLVDVESEVVSHSETQEIISSPGEKGRYMIAKDLIKKNELIFTERASSFVPITGFSHILCSNCGKTNIIPYPCLKCRGRVVYCSVNCQLENSSVHQYECPAYRFQLFAHVGIGHLALRTVLDNGLLSAVDQLKTKDSLQIWQSLTDGGDIWKSDLPYALSLRMSSHLDKKNNIDIFWFAFVSQLLITYLQEYTEFFDILQQKIGYDNIDWELIASSLVLRHIGQFMSNATVETTLMPKKYDYFCLTEYHLLDESMWSKAYHLKRGFLHRFGNWEDTSASNWPYLSLCNHSCVQSFYLKFSGRYVTSYALNDLSRGEEITNCYVLDHRKCTRSERQKNLWDIYHFQCTCKACSNEKDADKEFNIYHQYVCDNIACRQVFTPIIADRPSLDWWRRNSQETINVLCTHCKVKQRFEWHHNINRWLNHIEDSKIRRKCYQTFEETQNTLLGLSNARAHIAHKLALEIYKLGLADVNLDGEDFKHIITMLKFNMEVDTSSCSTHSLEYVSNLTLLWDLMALQKYKCQTNEMKQMLQIIDNVISVDLRKIFLNYYDDYISNMAYIGK